MGGADLQSWPSIEGSRRQNESLSCASLECNQDMQKNKSEQVELGVTADGGNSESVTTSSCQITLNLADTESVQQKIQNPGGGQWEDNRMEKKSGPKHTEADFTDDYKRLNEAVQLPTFSSTLEALIPDACHSRASGEMLETGGICGKSEESHVECKVTGHDEVNPEVSQTSWNKESIGNVPKKGMSGHAKESSSGCLQASQMCATNKTTGSEKGTNERKAEGLECDSAGHESTKDNSCGAQASCTEVTLQNMLSRSDLDPRVLCNTGWGQTQIKQSIAWDLEVDSSSESGRDWADNDQINHNRPGYPQWSRDVAGQGMGVGSQGGGHKKEQSEGKIDGKQSALLIGRGNSWVEAAEGEKARGWDGNRREGGQQREGNSGNWGPGDSEWGENKSRTRQGEKSWADSEDEGWRSRQHRHPQHIPNIQTALKGPNLQQSQSQLTQPRGLQEVRDPPTRPMGQNQSSGWKPSPIPHKTSSIEPSGWEEPSPQSITRNMEIDDGTSAWGDPAHYENRSVNMWEKSNLQQRDQASQEQHESMPATALINRDKNTGWE